MDAVNVVKEEYLPLCEFPDDLIEEILAWLPAEYLCRLRTVCKQWNTIFSSTRFITVQWAEAPPNKNPWLVVGDVEHDRDCWAYSFFTRSWKKLCLSLSFLEGEEAGTPPNPNLVSPSFRYLASGAGLFLIQDFSTNSIYVWNPLTAKRFILPPMKYREHFFRRRGSIGIVNDGEDGYKVLVVHNYKEEDRKPVEIYDSNNEAWRMAGVLSADLSVMQNQTVFSGDYFNCKMVADPFISGMMGFNMVEGTSIFVPFPDLVNDDLDDGPDVYFSGLVGCGLRILCVAGIGMRAGIPQEFEEEVIIWEFTKDAATNWKEISRMPPTLCPFPPTVKSFYVGIGDCLYLKKYGAKEVAVYNLTQNSWTLLPSYPGAEVVENPRLTAFKPMLDMRVV